MFVMFGSPRALVLVGVIGAAVFGPRVAEACSPGQLHAELITPVERWIPAQAVFWFSINGLGPPGVGLDLAPELVGPDGVSVPLTVSSVAPSSSQYGPSSLQRTVRVAAQLEPNTAYELTFSTALSETPDGEPLRETRSFFTSVESAPEPPPSPTAELAFAATNTAEPLRHPCSDGRFDEFTIIFAQATGAAAPHARTRYDGEAMFARPITRVLPPGAGGDWMFVWAVDRGLPCVELVAEGPDGRRSAPTVVCEAVGCAEGDRWAEGLGRDVEWWREEFGPESCSGVDSPDPVDLADPTDPAEGCACVAVPEGRVGPVGVFGLLVMLVALGARAGRRSGPDVCPSI